MLESSRDLQEPGCILYREEGLDMSFTLGTDCVWFGQVLEDKAGEWAVRAAKQSERWRGRHQGELDS